MNSSYRAITYLLVASCLISCDKLIDKEKKEIVFFYTSPTISKADTEYIKVEQIKRHNPKDTLIAYFNFALGERRHFIDVYTSDFYAPEDGGTLLYELDSLGVIYGRSTTWFKYSRLQSNNDSINEIIDVALEHIILRPELHCYLCQR
ncbi:hypothetical protein ACW9KT_09865 [Hymenobacter sp. HD11105]